MAGPYTPPNPYGSYFNFGAPEAIANAAFLPGVGANLSPGTLAASGNSVGGFNPTTAEHASNRLRDAGYQRFMADVLRSDSRVAPVSAALQQALFGSNEKLRQATVGRMGGMGNFNEAVGFMLNMPGLSGYMGGSARSLGLGAMAMATSGLSLNGTSMFGDGFLQAQAARSLFQATQRQFFLPGGAANLANTNGLNRDQIGGIQMMGAAQGAFAGLNMGTLSLSKGGTPNFQMDQSTIDKLTKFTKSAAKMVSGLIDIFGDASVGELAQKAHQITGLDFSRLGNPEAMVQRLAGLRKTAEMTGIDVQSMMDVTAGATRMGVMMGMTPAGAGSASYLASSNGAFRLRNSQANSNAFFVAGATHEELVRNQMRDIHGMLRDPMGSRRAALQMMIAEGTVPAGAAGDLMSRASGMGAGDLGRFDDEMRSRFGVNPDSYIRSMGGPMGLFRQLSPDSQASAITANQADMNRRSEVHIRRMLMGRLGNAGQANDFMTLVTGLSTTTGNSLLNALDSGAGARGLADIVKGDVAGVLSPDKFVNAALGLRGAGVGNAGAIHQYIRRAMENNVFTQGYIRPVDIAAMSNRPLGVFDEGDRGQFKGGFQQGLLERLNSQDPRSIFTLMARMSPNDIVGLNSPISLDRAKFLDASGKFDADGFRGNVERMHTQMMQTPEGRDAMRKLNIRGGKMGSGELREILDRISDPVQFQDAFQGFNIFNSTDGTNVNTMFARRSRMDAMKEFGTTGATAVAIAKQLQEAGKDPGIYGPLAALGETLIRGQSVRLNVGAAPGSQVVPFGEMLGKDRLSMFQTLAIQRASSWEVLRDMGVAGVTGIAGRDRLWGQNVADILARQEQIFANDPKASSKDKALIRDERAALEKMGYSEKLGAGVTKLTGILRLEGDTLQIINGLLSSGPK